MFRFAPEKGKALIPRNARKLHTISDESSRFRGFVML
jgi:hypothetical protein